MKNLILIIAILFAGINLYAQTDVPNLEFDEWETDASGLFEEPVGNWWGTLNKLRLLGPGAPITTTKTDDAHSGAYAAMLENKMFGTFKISAILASGYFAPMQTSFIEGRSFTGRLAKMTGWYKYKSVNNDSAGAYITLFKWNALEDKKDTIAKGALIFYDKGEMNAYEKFEIELAYYSEEFPDTINIGFIASAGTTGLSNSDNVQIGSTLYIDEVSLVYPTGVELPLMSEIEYYVLGTGTNLTLVIKDNVLCQNAELIVYSITGAEMQRQVVKNSNGEIPLMISTSGTYFFVLNVAGKTIGGELFKI